MRNLSVGLGVVQAVFFLALIVIVAAVAIGLSSLFLILWATVAIARRIRVAVIHLQPTVAAQAPRSHRAEESVPPRPSALQIAAAVAAGLSGAATFVGWINWYVFGLAAFSAVGGLRGYWDPEGMTPTTSLAMKVSAALGAVIAMIMIMNLWLNAPEALRAREVPNHGNAANIESAWANAGCLAGTAALNTAPHPPFTFDSDAVSRVGSCRVRDDADNEERDVYFFEADSVGELRAWLFSGDLHVDQDFKRKADVYNDGVVAIASWDAGSHLTLLNAGYDGIRWD